MTTPTYCTSCGHELGVGRFCTNCGKPVPGRHPEAVPTPDGPPAPVTEQAPAPPTAVVPPPVGQLPPSPRYPLFAEPPPTVMRPAGGSGTTSLPPLSPPTAPRGDVERRPAPGWLPWLVALVLLALVAGVGGYLLVSSGDDDKADDRAGNEQTSTPRPSGDGSSGADQPDSSGTGGPVTEPDPADVVDLTAGITAEVPAVAPPSRDRANRPVLFVPENMWDGRPRTSWRMPGDGTGQTLTFDLGQDVVITEVGMINGYAKVDGPDNWYRGNRRIRAVQWEFDDGTRITQEFADGQQIQMADIGPVATRTIRVHLLTVTPPGKGANGRDYTAISEIRFLGAPVG